MTLHLFTSDSVFEEEGVETPPTAARPAEEGDKPESSPNSAESEATEGEEGEHQPTQMHSGTGQGLLIYPIFVLVILFLLCLFCGLKMTDLWPLLQEVSTQPTLSPSRRRCPHPGSEQRVSR